MSYFGSYYPSSHISGGGQVVSSVFSWVLSTQGWVSPTFPTKIDFSATSMDINQFQNVGSVSFLYYLMINNYATEQTALSVGCCQNVAYATLK